MWFVSLFLLRAMWIFMTWIPSLSPGRFLLSRSALKWSINSIRTPTPLWRFSTHVSASSAPHYSPKSSPAAHPLHTFLLQTALEDIPHGTVRSLYTVKQMKDINLAARGYFHPTEPQISCIILAWGRCEHLTWQMYTHMLVLLKDCIMFCQDSFAYREWFM